MIMRSYDLSHHSELLSHPPLTCNEPGGVYMLDEENRIKEKVLWEQCVDCDSNPPSYQSTRTALA